MLTPFVPCVQDQKKSMLQPDYEVFGLLSAVSSIYSTPSMNTSLGSGRPDAPSVPSERKY